MAGLPRPVALGWAGAQRALHRPRSDQKAARAGLKTLHWKREAKGSVKRRAQVDGHRRLHCSVARRARLSVLPTGELGNVKKKVEDDLEGSQASLKFEWLVQLPPARAHGCG